MAAKTSLARQLELLKLPQTSAQKETHGSASFLYDFLEAKTIDADTHFSLALTGLEKLIKIDPYVETFKETLFHESSKKFNRGIESKESNEKINIIIEEFLFRVVSKYFQLSDTHKAIEWLIYRYKVNEYNVDALIGSVLPYHETRQFVRLLQTCSEVKNPRNSKWYWLKSVQENGVPLTKSFLLQHCVSNTEFVRFITDSVFKSLQIDAENSLFPSFLVSFCLNLLERSTSEITILIICSALSKALRMKNQSLYVASYLIFAHLCSVTTLDSTLVQKLLKSFAKRSKGQISEGALFAFNIICHSQDIDILPIEFLTEDLVSSLVNHSSEINNFNCLVKCMLLSIVQLTDESLNEDSLKTYKEYVQKLFEVNKGLPEDTVVSLIVAVNDSIEKRAESNASLVEDLCSYIVTLAEKRFPAWFDKAITSLQSVENISFLLKSFRYSIVKQANVPLFLGLDHSSKRIRRQSMLHFANNFNTFLNDQNETNMQYLKHIIKSHLLKDLNNTNVDTLLEIFSIKEKIFNLFTPNEYEIIASQIVNVCIEHQLEGNQDGQAMEQSVKWNELKKLVFQIYCTRAFEDYHCSQDKVQAVFSSLFFGEHGLRLINYLLPTSNDQLTYLSVVLNSNYAQSNPVLKQISNDSKLKKSLSKITDNSSQIITENVLKYIVQFCSENLKVLLNEPLFQTFFKEICLDNAILQRRTSMLLTFILTKVYRQLAEANNVDDCQTLGKFLIDLLLVQLTYFKLNTRASVKIVELSQYDQLDVMEHFGAQLNVFDGSSISNFLVGYVLYSLVCSIDLSLISNDTNERAMEWRQIDKKNELFYFKLYRILLRFANPTEGNFAKKKTIKLFRNLLTLFLRKLILPESSNYKNEKAFRFFFLIITSSSNLNVRMQTLSLLDNLLQISEFSVHLIASLQAQSQYLVSYLVALSSSFLSCRQLTLQNIKTIYNQIDHASSLSKFIKLLIEAEGDILTNENNVPQILSSATTKNSLSLQLMEGILALLTGPLAANLSVSLRKSLLNLLTFSKVHMKLSLYDYYFSKFFPSGICKLTTISLDEEGELLILILFLRHDQENIFASLDEKPNHICQFYLALIGSIRRRLSKQLALKVLEILDANLLRKIRITNNDFALELVSTLLKVQLNLSESGPLSSTNDNLALINVIKRKLRRITKDGAFILQMLQTLMPIEEIYDTFTYAKKEPSVEKRARRLDTEKESKYATGWKLLRIYVGSFQNLVGIENSTLLVKTLFDYLKLTFMEVDDNSNEYTRQTVLYAIVNCIESKLDKKSSALKQEKSRVTQEQNEDDIDTMEVDVVQDSLELKEFLNSINVDNIVDCMRESRLRETQKVALLLISLIAPHFQKQILDYLVAIFTFIGTSLLQCDDQYSLAILFETMESIIPIILQNEHHDATSKTKENLAETDMRQYIISIFIRSFWDIPSYRRLPLFAKMVQLLGEEHFLSILSVRLLEETCLSKSKNRSEKELLLSFLQALFSEFSPNTQLSSLCTLLSLFDRKFLDYHLKKKSIQKQSTDEQFVKPRQSPEESQLALISLKNLTGEICKSFSTKIVFDSDKLACGVEILRFIVLVISNVEFIEVSVQLASGSLSTLLIHFVNLLLEVIVSLGPSDSSMKPSLNLYRKRIKSTLDEILLKYNSLLPPEKLIEIVIEDLLNNSFQTEPYLSALIKRKALELLNEKLMRLGPKELKQNLPIQIIKSLDRHLPNEEEQISKLEDVQIHNIQLILLSLKFATKFDLFSNEEITSSKASKCLSNAYQHVSKLASKIVIKRKSEEDISARGKSLQNLKSSCILCLTQILCTMSLEGIKYLSSAVDLILANFDVNDDIILISNVSSLSKIITKFAQFLSPHLKSIILKLLYAYTWCDKIPNFRSKLQINWTNLAKLVPKRVMFEAIDASYEEATAISPQSLIELMSLFKLSCDNLDKTDVDIIVKSFKNFMIKALSYRSIHHENVDLVTIEHIEASFGEAFSAFIPKLTEASFRPIFYKLLEWAVHVEDQKRVNKSDKSCRLADECYFRMIAFYRFCSLLADRLKSLFCVFVAPSIVNNCSEMLLAYHSSNFEDQPDEYDQFMDQTSKSLEGKLKLSDSILGEPLIVAILATLSKCFLYDLNATFANKDCTSLLVKPIVNQVSNSSMYLFNLI